MNEVENTESKGKYNKFLSRKFLVWIVWAILAVACLFVDNAPIDKTFEYFGIVSTIYIGANAAGDFSPIFKKSKESE